MKIGILSMQRVKNYGSFLQAYALKIMLEKRGHRVTFLDIEKKKGYNPKKINKLHRLMKRLKNVDLYLYKRIIYSKKNSELNALFENQQKYYLGLLDREMKEKSYDMVVIGSDEIFNASSYSEWGINSQRFGLIPYAGRTISYAASCGYTCSQDMNDAEREEIGKALLMMQDISVRDENTGLFVKELSKREPVYNLDPVLIYDFEDEIKQGEREGYPQYPYMVVYAYHNRIKSKNEIKAIKSYAKKRKLRTIAIGGSLPWCDEFAVISPFQVLAYFKHAECIVTDTFHGTVIAAKFNKPVAVIVRDSNSNKLMDLIKRLHIVDSVISDPHELESVFNNNNDYVSCNEIIETGKIEAFSYFDRQGL